MMITIYLCYLSRIKTYILTNQFLVVILFLVGGSFTALGQGSICTDPLGENGAEPFCSSVGIVFPNCNIQNSECTRSAEAGPEYGCLDSQPFPAWYYLRVDDPGTMRFNIVQTANENGTGNQLDVDFICYGPFSDPVSPCTSQLTSSAIVDCSFSPSFNEFMTVPDAVRGEYYLVLITNFSQQPGYISFQKVSGEGSTDCSILEVLLGPNQTICGADPVELDGTTEGAVRYEWAVFNETTMMYDVISGETSPTLTVTVSGQYQLSVEDEQGDIVTDSVIITYAELPLVSASVPNLNECALSFENENTAIFNLTNNDANVPEGTHTSGQKVLYYASQTDYNNKNPISDIDARAFQNTSNPQTIFASIINTETGCESANAGRFNLFVQPLPAFTDSSSFEGSSKVCVFQDGSLQETVLLGQNIGDVDGNTYIYDWTPDNQDLDGDGHEDAIFVVDALTEDQVYTVSITRKATSDTDVDCTNAINPETGEIYQVQLLPTSSPLAVNYEVEEKVFSENYTITAIPEFSIGESSDFEYQLNDQGYQDSPVFTGVSAGDYVITVRNKFGCTPEMRSETIELLGYPRYFTPNGDGFHDTWSLVNIEDQPAARIYIFDRYGKLLKQLRAGGIGWDGTFNGKNMPSSEYWFRLEYNDPGDQTRKVFSGSFSLIR